jgi:hypothetical protein
MASRNEQSSAHDAGSVDESAPPADASVPDDESLLAGFEDCTLPESQWTHQAHIRVAYLYLRSHPFDAALERMRTSLVRYNLARKVPNDPHRGYHETLTIAWLTVVASVMKHHGLGQDSLDFCAQQPSLPCRCSSGSRASSPHRCTFGKRRIKRRSEK